MSRIRLGSLCAALLLVFVASADGARAQRAAIDVEHFLAHLDGKGLFNSESGEILYPWQVSAGVFLHYSKEVRVPFAVTGPAGERRRDRFGVTLVTSLAFTDWLQAGLALPFGVWTTVNRDLPGETSLGSLGTMRFQLKFRVLRQQRHGISMSIIPMLRLPTGDDGALVGESFAFSPMVALERSFGPARVLLNLGFTTRSRATFGDLVVDDEFFVRFGAGWRVAEWVEVGAEIAAATNTSSTAGSPAEFLFGARFFALRDAVITVGMGPGISSGYGSPVFRFFAGLVYSPSGKDTDGDGIIDKKDRCPKVKGIPENQGCPAKDTDGDGVPDHKDRCPKVAGPAANGGCPWPDADNDGVPDKDDRCPKRPGPKSNQGCPVVSKDRDRDGVLDKDDRCPDTPGPRANRGCPWPDTDKDGVLDKDDRCPRQPGPASNQGCPLAKVVVTKTELVISEQVYFRFGSASLRRISRPILNAVARALKKYPDIRVEVQGHTDDIGSDAANQRLSQRRAQSVRSYLIGQGIAADRLVARGYGEARPLIQVDPKTMSRAEITKARAKNRRVQFLIIKK